MNRYFSRLAQRSGVNANTPVARFDDSSSHAESGWGEQTVETIADVDGAISTPRNGNSEPSGKNSDNPGTIQSNPERSRVSAPLVDRSLESNTSGITQAGNHMGLMTDTAAVANPLDAPSHFLKSRQSGAVDLSESKGSKNSVVVDNGTVVTKTASETAERGLVYSKKNGSQNDEKTRAAYKTIEPVTAYGDTSSETIVHSASAKIQASKTDAGNWHRENGTVAQSPAHSEKILSRQSAVQSAKFEAIKSGPAHSSTPHIQAIRASSSSSIEVNIGKIELEIITPARKAASAPAAAPAKVSASKPAAVFNPHRHYLRGR